MTTAGDGMRKHHGVFLLLLAIAISVLFFWMIQSFVAVLVLAGVLASLVYPVYTRLLARLGGRKGLAAGITVTLGLLIVVVPLLVLLGFVANEAVGVSKSAVAWVEAQKENPAAVDRALDKLHFIDKKQVYAKTGDLAHKSAQYVVGGLTEVTAGTARLFLLIFVMLYATFHFLLDGAALPYRILSHLPLSEDDKHRALTTFTTVGRATLVGAVVIGVIQGGLAGLAFAVVGINGALLWTVVMAVASVIPGIGTALVWVPAVIYLLVEGQYGAAIGLAAWCSIVVGSIDNFLRPRLVGKGANLPNLLVLLGTLGGLLFFGIVGIVIGPVIAALFVTFWKMYASTLGNDPAVSTGGDQAGGR